MLSDRLAETEFAENPEPRCPVVLLLDTSGSMGIPANQPITQLNEGIKLFEQALKADPLASLRVEVALITFGGGVHVVDVTGMSRPLQTSDASLAFVTADSFEAPVLRAHGETPMGEAVTRALALLRQRKDMYKNHGIDYFRPWILLVTDGQPTDSRWRDAAAQAREEERRDGVIIFPVGVQDADMRALAEFSNRPPLLLRGLVFNELFQWLSKSLSAVSRSNPGEQVALAPVGWAQIDTSR